MISRWVTQAARWCWAVLARVFGAAGPATREHAPSAPQRPTAPRTGTPAPPRPTAPRTGTPAPQRPTAPPQGRHLVYCPELDGRADPGEIVWTWVAYEDQPTCGKDRPVLVVGRDGATLLGLMLSSQQRRDGQRHWFALGTGAWDQEARPSWIRLDRVLDMTEEGIRREGAILDRAQFEMVASELRNHYGWR